MSAVRGVPLWNFHIIILRTIDKIIFISLNVKSSLSAVGGVPVVPVAPEVTSSQFHSQDEVNIIIIIIIIVINIIIIMIVITINITSPPPSSTVRMRSTSSSPS